MGTSGTTPCLQEPEQGKITLPSWLVESGQQGPFALTSSMILGPSLRIKEFPEERSDIIQHDDIFGINFRHINVNAPVTPS